jgi:glutaryl-CoA dehydrogenase
MLSSVRSRATTAILRRPSRFFATLSADDEPPEVFSAFGSDSYQWDDPFLFRSQLTDEECTIWDAASDFCQGALMPGIVERNRNEKTLDHAMMQEFGSVGLLGATLPETYGGSGLGYVSYGLLATEVERVDSAYRSAMSVQSSLVMYPIYAYASEDIKRKLLPELAAGRLIGCFGLTEPNHGSDPSSMETRAVYDAGTNEYVLNGSKNWITNSPIADVFVVRHERLRVVYTLALSHLVCCCLLSTVYFLLSIGVGTE